MDLLTAARPRERKLEPTVTLHVYDTTLRDGAQQEGISLSVTDKLAIAPLLDELGVGFIEGGWPGAVPKDTDFFARAARELTLKNAVLAAFGATRKVGVATDKDPQVRALLDSQAPVVTLVAKSDIRHVERALKTDGAENLAMIRDTVAFLVGEGRRVFVDAEHFFDGYRYDPIYATNAALAAFDAGAEVVCLCDTNGGMLPNWVSDIVSELRERTGEGILGMHAHNDSGCAVANTLAALDAGAEHFQGTVNGYGERTGNVDLITTVANLEIKYDRRVLRGGRLDDATRIAHAISEITNISPFARQPYVGASAFAHKAGLHASAIKVDADLYQHTDPTKVGNDMRMLVSDMAGRASIELKGKELGFDLAGQTEVLTRITNRVKSAEQQGYTYEAADASFDLVLRDEVSGGLPEYFTVESWRAIVENYGSTGDEAIAEATVKLHAGGERIIVTAEGNGPVNALDQALRHAVEKIYPEISKFELIDFKVRILDQEQGTDAITRVLIETTDGVSSWFTVGIGPNILEASWEALIDSAVYGLIHAEVKPVA